MSRPWPATARRLALVRFSSLGDVLLAGWVVSALREEHPELELRFLTKASFREALPILTDEEVWTLSPTTNLPDLARRLRLWKPDLVVDLHGTLRARLLRLATPGLRWRRLQGRALRRRLWIHLGLPDPAAPHVVERYAEAIGIPPPPRRPWWPVTPRPENEVIALAPGARWATKRWPDGHWQRFAELWRARGGRLVWLGGANEAATIERLAHDDEARLIGRPLAEVAATIATSEVVVASDSAMAHLAAAVGTPVVALFGPTVPGFGFRPWGEHAILERIDLPCRPCALHGGDRCPRGDHACLVGLPPERLFSTLERMRSASPRRAAR